MIIEDIVDLAESLAEDHKGRSVGGDPIVAFNDYEVDVVERDFKDAFEGLLRYKDGEFQVFINSGDKDNPRTVGRRRFTAAHEFGHYSIPAHREAIRSGDGFHKDVSGFKSIEPMEREADVFAAHFLVPTSRLKRKCGSGRWGAEEVIETAKHFGVSIMCAALRCQDSLGGQSTLLAWGPSGRRWQRMDRDWWFKLPSRAIRNFDQLVRGSATERLMRGEDIPPEGYLRAGTSSAAWFPRVRPGSRNDHILIEEVIPLGAHGCLTILRADDV